MSDKKSILTKLVEEDKLKKQADDAEIDQTTADKLAKEIYEQIFDEELKKLVGL